MVYFFDIDGVIADCSHRVKYLKDKDYDKFYSYEEMMKDKPIRCGIDFLEDVCCGVNTEIYYLTGRPARTLGATRDWMKKYGIIEAPIFMRKNHDYRRAGEVKLETLKKFYEHDPWEGEAIFIDDCIDNIKTVGEPMPNVRALLFGTNGRKP